MTYLALYLLAGFVLHGLFAIRTPYEDTRVVFWLCLCWPLTVAVAVLMVFGHHLRALGFRFRRGLPRDGIRWRAGWVEPLSRNHPGPRRRGFWLACPWQVVAFWWVRPEWWG